VAKNLECAEGGMRSFAEELKRHREKSGLSQRALARATRINPAIISRMEAADRGPSGPEQVLAIAAALDLDEARCDRLLASAGYWPGSILRLGPQDETLLAVAQLLAGDAAGDESKRRFRQVVGLLVEQWIHPDSR
jgi:transcriptional regulator with XRE-family HTH domain